MIKLLQWCTRLGGLAALILGLLIGRVGFSDILRLHMMLGYLVVAALTLIALSGIFARLSPALPGLALVWASATLYVALEQGHLITGDSHWIIEVVHAALGIGAMGLADAMGARFSRRSE